MSTSKLFRRSAYLALLSLLLSSCKKVIGYFEEHQDAYNPPCRITNYRVDGGSGQANFVITYDTKGNPISMMDSNRVNPFGTDQYFRYDRLDRLSDYMATYPPSLFAVEWHKYVYARSNYVIDTAMFYETGDVRGPSPIAKNSGEYRINAYTLDELGRITKIWDIPNDSPNIPSLETTLIYDANGNLPSPSTGTMYDTKVNIYRTNKIWQFVYQNYSRNNLVSEHFGSLPQYNIFGLPLNLQNLEVFNDYPFNEPNLDVEAVLNYACDVPQGPLTLGK